MHVDPNRTDIIGIDLGTTNSAVAKAPADGQENRIELFRVPQLTGPGEFAPLAVLPSFLYLPGDYDVDAQAIRMPWPTSEDAFVGAFARDQGAAVPARLVSSAKSWLCHPNVDRKARILPWGTSAELKKRSPVQATAAYLAHIKRAWNHRLGEEEEALFENQTVILTVPASFDEVARELTLEAARLAGYPPVTLLEEPLAAFYSWLARHETRWPDLVRPDELILVCDVGGGTTDFTLVTLKAASGGGPRFERIAVGDHLLLGGDNMDLALARLVERSWSGTGGQLSADRWKALGHQCRQAKEQILSGTAERYRIALAGKGSRLIGDTLTAELDREAVEQTILDGFFPLVETIRAQGAQRKAIAEFGLPYESDPAVTRHLIRFLERHRENVAAVLGKTAPMPDLVLFNGGALAPRVIQDKILAALRHWFKPQAETVPRVLENPVPDLAVALGAAYYGLVKIGRGVRVGSGAPRAYYLGIERAAGEAASAPQAVCLVERGVEEGAVIALSEHRFEVLANQPVRFEIYSSSYRSGDRSGQIVSIDDTFTALPPLQTVIQYGRQGIKKAIPVRIEAHYSEVGTLSLFCRSLTSGHRWQLQFQLRAAAAPTEVREGAILEEAALEGVRTLVIDAFREGRNALSILVKQIAQVLELPREQWPLSLLRDLADTLLSMPQARQSTPLHEARWMNLTGFCLRPGMGHGLDPQRIQKAWRLYAQGPIHAKNTQVRCEWWIMWRRIAAGLSAGQQRQISQDATPLLNPPKGGKISLSPQERSELCMALANMERLSVKDKIMWGRWLLARMRPAKPGIDLAALARLGARELLYGPADRVIPPQEAGEWIDRLLSHPWQDRRAPGRVIIQLARKTGDRTRDLDPAVIARIVGWLDAAAIPAEQRRCLSEVMPLARQEEQEIFGESLPAGLVLREAQAQGA